MKYDVIVIGGGPAGMIAAIAAAQQGASVCLLEKNAKLGVKLVLTGKGRCNITTGIKNNKEIIEKFNKGGKFLHTALHRFSSSDAVNFFESRGLATKLERGQRIFPVSDCAGDVLDVLISEMKKYNVKIVNNSEVKKIKIKEKAIEKVITSKSEYVAKKYIICTGGKSYPKTGSTGDIFRWAEQLGHTTTKSVPSLCSIAVKEKFVTELEGLSLRNVSISVYKEKKKIDSRTGEAIFTDTGISGPIILDMSKTIALNLPDVFIRIDFKPALEYKQLDSRIKREFASAKNKQYKNILEELLPKKLIPLFIRLSKIEPQRQANSITKIERNKMLHLLKEFELCVTASSGFAKAIITSGGVNLQEIDPRTMRSKKIKNLFFCGEVLDLDGPTGGFNLQVCWSTGYLAGVSSVL